LEILDDYLEGVGKQASLNILRRLQIEFNPI
jgi:hypothetical protein